MHNAAMYHRLIVFALAVLGFAPPIATAADAPVTFTVNTVVDKPDDNVGDLQCHTDANTCSLRAAIMQANHLDTGGLVTINLPPGIYKLTIPPSNGDAENSGDLNLTTPAIVGQHLVIKGANANNTIIDGNQIAGVMTVAPNRWLDIFDVTIRNGFRQGAAPTSGGGIDNGGTLTITRCVIEGNHANSSSGGSLGGGIVNTNVLNVVGSTIRANVGVLGGGIYSVGPATIRDSTISGNGADSGGGIANSNVLYVVDSTISSNSANTNGGGIVSYGSAILYNTTVVDNDADHDHDENGGIGGGVYSVPGHSFGVVNTLITGNTQLDSIVADDCFGTLTAFGWNLFGDVTGCTIPNGAAWGFIARNTLGPLQDNGGPTLTHALLPGSRAVDTTDNDLGCIDETGAQLGEDQRGFPRVAGARCDVGAFEYGAVIDSIFRNGFDFL